MRLLFDENFNHKILRGLRIRFPVLDTVVAQETNLKGADDPSLLNSAAEQDRIVITHDVSTIPKFAYERLSSGLAMPGVIVVPETMPIGEAIAELLIIVECSEQSEYVSQVVHLPI